MDVHGGSISMSDPSSQPADRGRQFQEQRIGTNNLKYGAAYAPNIETDR